MPPIANLRAAFRTMIADQKPDAFLTFNLHHGLPVPVLDRIIKDFFNRMQREVDGRYWSRLPSQDRPRGIGAAEHPHSNTHAHIAMAAPPRYLDFVFSDAAEPLWRRCHVNAGQFCAKPVTDVAGLAGYTLKDVRGMADLDRIIAYAPMCRVPHPAPKSPHRSLVRPSRGLSG